MTGSQSSTTTSSDLPQFSSRYELQMKLGAGGKGTVYKAYDSVLKKHVAVKLLMPGRSDEKVLRFQKEAKATAKLNHVNIVRVLDFGQTGKGDLYLIMDYIDGVNLAKRVDGSGHLPLLEALEIFCQICDALEHAHSHDVLHRDIKPENIMLTADENGNTLVKIVDFGLAKIEHDDQKITSTGVHVGSPPFMSPEQASGKEVDRRSDLYSLGCVMFMALTGNPPLMGQTGMDTILKQIEEQPPRLNDQYADGEKFPAQIESMIDKLLRKDPRQRYSSAEELNQELLELQEHESFKNKSAAVMQAKKTNRRLNQMLIASVCIILALLVAVACIVGGSLKDETDAKISTFQISHQLWEVASGDLHDNHIKDIVTRIDRSSDRLALRDPRLADSDLAYIRDLPLVALDLTGTEVGGSTLIRLSSMSSLRSLILNDNNRITDEVVHELAKNKNLTILGLRGTGITDKGVASLAKMSSLISLDISENPNITGNSLQQLRKLPELVALRIGETKVTKADLPLLLETKLLCLSLSNLDLDDSDLTLLGQLRAGSLDLSDNPKITDTGLNTLSGRKYWNLNVMGCPNVTEEQIATMRQASTETLIYSNKKPYISGQGVGLPDELKFDPARALYDPECMRVWSESRKLTVEI